jgi:hypothetical protein
MSPLYDSATGHEIRSLKDGKYAGTQYLVDSAGKYQSLYKAPTPRLEPFNYPGPTDSSGNSSTATVGETNSIGSAVSNNTPNYTGIISSGFGDLNNYLGGQFKSAADSRIANAEANLNMGNTLNDEAINREALATASRNQIGENINTGFGDVTDRFNTVDTNLGNVQNSVDTGFVNQAAGFADAQTNRDELAQAAQSDRNTQFKATGEALDTGFGAATNQLTEAQANVLEGQAGLGTTLQTMGDTADIYAGQSLENQEAMQSDIDRQTSVFDDYVNRYSEDTRLAQASRRDLENAQANFANQMSADVARYSDNAGRDFESLQLELAAIRDQQLSDAAAAVEADYQNNLSQLLLGANAQSGNLVPSGLGSPFSSTQ